MNLNGDDSDLKDCVKVEVDVLVSSSLTVLVELEQGRLSSELKGWVKVEVDVLG